MKRIQKLLLLFVFFILAPVALTYGAVPTLMSYQGKLVDSSGVPLDGNVAITFTLYTASTGGTTLWTEAYTGVSPAPYVSVSQGHFSVSLGSLTPISPDVFSGSTVYLGVKIGADSEMTPRVSLLTTPYAFNSSRLDGFPKESFLRADIDNSLTRKIQLSVSKNADWATSIEQLNSSGYGMSLKAPGFGTSLIFKVATNNVNNIIQIQKNGKIGIGVTTAYETLEVKGTVKATKFLDQDGNQIKSVDQVWSRPAPDGDIYFLNANVGINNQYPSYQLDVSGNTRIKSKVLIGNGSMSSDMLTVIGNVNATSFVGSGTSLTGILTNLGGDSVSGSTVRYLNQRGLWSTVNVTSGLTSGKVTYFNGTNFADSVMHQSGASIGIGKTNPSTALDVNGTITATTFVGSLAGSYLTGVVDIARMGGDGTSGSTTKYLNQKGLWSTVNATSGLTTGKVTYFNGTNFADSVLHQSGSSIGIGKTNPATALDVNGTITGTAITATTLAGSLAGSYLTGTVDIARLGGNGATGSDIRFLNQKGTWVTASVTAGLTSGNITFYTGTGLSNSRIIQWGGKIGIGISNPSAELHVSGNIKTKTIDILGGADVAEAFDVSGEKPVPGMVMVIDEKKPGYLKISTKPNDKKVAGIVSGANGLNPGVILNKNETLNGTKYPIALAGRVWVMATDDGGKIWPGDLLTTSSKPGTAMKVTNRQKAQGGVIGKAMSEVRNGTVLVLVNLQ